VVFLFVGLGFQGSLRPTLTSALSTVFRAYRSVSAPRRLQAMAISSRLTFSGSMPASSMLHTQAQSIPEGLVSRPETLRAVEPLGSVREPPETPRPSRMSAGISNEVSRNVQEAVKGVTDIARNIAQLAAGSTDVARNAAEAAKGMNDVARNVAVVSTASRDTTQGATGTHTASRELARLAEQLQKAVGNFRLSQDLQRNQHESIHFQV